MASIISMFLFCHRLLQMNQFFKVGVVLILGLTVYFLGVMTCNKSQEKSVQQFGSAPLTLILHIKMLSLCVFLPLILAIAPVNWLS